MSKKREDLRAKAEAMAAAAERAELLKRHKIAEDARKHAINEWRKVAPEAQRAAWQGAKMPADTSNLTQVGLTVLCLEYGLVSWEVEGAMFQQVYNTAYIHQWNDLYCEATTPVK